MTPATMLIAQISDCHVRPSGKLALGKFDTYGALTRAVDHLNSMRPSPDVVLVTGDITYDGTAEEYAAARTLLNRLETPWLPIPGNHDDRGNMRAAFEGLCSLADVSAHPYISYTVDDYPVRLIALDTVIPDASNGMLCTARLSWLANRLEQAPDRPTVIFMHHPPFATGLHDMDSGGFGGAEELGTLVGQHRQVRRILCGHLHRVIQRDWCGTLAMTSPATCFQIELQLAPRRNRRAP